MAVVSLLVVGTLVGFAEPVSASSASVALGMDVNKSTGVTAEQAVTNAEAKIGHKFAFTRDFLLWDSPFPTSYENWLGRRGTVPMISVKSRRTDLTPVKWADVATAQPGSALYAQMVSWANRVRDFGYPVYFTFNHEPEAKGNLDLGDATDFIAAWRRMHDLFAAQGATNAKFMWIMTSYAFQVPSSDRRYGAYWYPGDAYVDGIASDAYNWSNCRYPHGPWQSLAQTISGFMAFGRQHPSIPLWLTEFATVERDAGEKAGWIADAQALFKQPAYSQIAGVSYFDQTQYGVPCYWKVDTSTSSVNAMSVMAQDSFYQGSVDAVETAPTSRAPAFVASAATTANSNAEIVRVPNTVTGGDGLVLIATSASPTALTAPAGWTTVAKTSSASMYSAVWQRIARGSDPGTAVTVKFGISTKGAVQLLAYAGTNAARPVQSATASTVEQSMSSLTTRALRASAPGQRVVSYWAVRASLDTQLKTSGGVVRSSQLGSGGGQITALSADSNAATPAGRTASVSPAATHGITWTVLLTSAN